MIDLHTHTTYSDGTWNVETLLKNAEQSGVHIISITDHDTIKAHKELQNNNYYHNIFSGKIIIGGEFNCIFNYAKIELLGYNFDIDKLNKWINITYSKEKIQPNLNEEFKLIMNACYKNKIKVDNIEYNSSMGWPIDIILPSIKKYTEKKIIY